MGKRVVTVFGSGQVREDATGYRRALELGRVLAQAGFTVCNGGYGGVMEASARGARQAGGQTIGITMRHSRKPANRWIGDPRPESTWQDRLFKLIETGDAYVFLDGGTGTLTELFVAWEMANQALIQKTMVLYGPFVKALVRGLKKKPWVVLPLCLKTAGTPQAVLRILGSDL